MELTAVMVLMFLLHLCHSFGNTMIDLGGRVFKKTFQVGILFSLNEDAFSIYPPL